jgi:hypothetical protein
MAPAFSLAHIKQMTPIFTDKAEELSEKLTWLAKEGGQARWSGNGETGVVNVTELLDCASFDIIGRAGFGVDFEVSEGYPPSGSHVLISPFPSVP